MKHSIFLGAVVAALFFVGCGDGGPGVLTGASPVGTWKIDRAASEPLIQKGMQEMPQLVQAKEMMAKLPEAQRVAAQKLMDEQMVTQMAGMWTMFDAMRVTLSDDGKYTVVLPDEPKPKTGTWTIDGEKLTITSDKKDGDDEEDKDIPNITFKDGQLHLSSPDMPFSMIMKRAD